MLLSRCPQANFGRGTCIQVSALHPETVLGAVSLYWSAIAGSWWGLDLSRRSSALTWICNAGPGLAVRVLGDVTEGNALEVLRQVDECYTQTIRDWGLYDEIWQAFAVFLPVRYALRGVQRTRSMGSR